MNDSQPKYPDNFPQVLDIEGWGFCPSTKAFVRTTFRNYTDSGLSRQRSAFLVGSAGLGKSTLQRALGRYWAEGYQKSIYVYTGSLDPLGLASKAGSLGRSGAFLFADCEFESLQHTRLTQDQVKSLLLVYETGHVPAWHHRALLPAGVPRCFSCNLGEKADPGGWFSEQGQDALACVARQDLPKLLELGDSALALARRVLIFVLPDTLGLVSETPEADAAELAAAAAQRVQAARAKRARR